jgi:DNA-binding NarL/FixJ family response regulator/class 3 adenylate cyclase
VGKVSVTLLFTDIEGSTQLAHRLGQGYVGVLSEHRQLVRRAVDEAGGRELDCRADEFSAAFDRPDEAVGAAIEVQRSHEGHEWPAGAPVRVRVGIHTGNPTLEDGDYYGPDVHLAARLCEAGHGGQVLLSEAARELVDGIESRDLGEHELRGLPEPLHIHQLLAPGLEAEHPPLRAAAASTGPDEPPLRVVVADDSVLLREGVARLLEDAGFEIVGQAGNPDELLLRVRSYSPDVAIVDIKMPPTHTDEGLQAARVIREKHPGTGVLVLSQFVESGYALELLSESAEGVGYLLKDRIANVDDFCAAVRRVAEGGSALDPEVVSRLVGRRRRGDPLSELTPREREVLELMAEGRTNQAIAERMFVTMRAVEKHVTSIFQKLGLPAAPEDHRRVLAVLAYLRR